MIKLSLGTRPSLSLSKKQLAALLSAIGLFACKEKLKVEHNTGYVVGITDDIVPLDNDNKQKLPERSVDSAVLIATIGSDQQVKFCSGTLIHDPSKASQANLSLGNDDALLILTNHHCFAQTGSDGKATQQLLPDACTNTVVYFGFMLGETASSFASSCQPGSLRTVYEADIAVFGLSKKPPNRFKPAEFWDGNEAPLDRQAFLVHFPDVEKRMANLPQGTITRADGETIASNLKLPTASLTVTDCNTLGAFEISEWDLDRTLPFSLRHTCDLIHGSSGSGLFDLETGKLLGVNWGGIMIAIGGSTVTYNVATRANFVRSFLLGKGDEFIQQMEAERQSYDANAHKRSRRVDNKAFDLANRLRGGCGVIQTLSSGNSLGGTLILFALLPVLGLWIKRRKSHL